MIASAFFCASACRNSIDAILDRGEVIRRAPDRRKMADQRLEDIHRLVVIDDVDKLQRGDLRTPIGFELNQIFRGKTDQRLPDGRA